MDKLDPKIYDLETRGSNTSLLIVLEAALTGHAIEYRAIGNATPHAWTTCNCPARMTWDASSYSYRVQRPELTPSELLHETIKAVVNDYCCYSMNDAFGEDGTRDMVKEIGHLVQQIYIDPIDKLANTNDSYEHIVAKIGDFVDNIVNAGEN